jgi:hypothetical protein
MSRAVLLFLIGLGFDAQALAMRSAGVVRFELTP